MRIKLATVVLITVLGQVDAAPAIAQVDPRGQATELPEARRLKPLVAVAWRDLTFGTVLPGIPTTVPSDHPRHAGLFEVQGAKDGAIRVEFLLPAALASRGGALLPILFGPGDGGFDFSRGRRRAAPFDPRAPLIASLGPNGRLWLKLGGTVLPSRSQAGGAYAATISITVFDLGS